MIDHNRSYFSLKVALTNSGITRVVQPPDELIGIGAFKVLETNTKD